MNLVLFQIILSYQFFQNFLWNVFFKLFKMITYTDNIWRNFNRYSTLQIGSQSSNLMHGNDKIHITESGKFKICYISNI